MTSQDYYVIAHYVFLQKHPLDHEGYNPRELLTTADSREEAIQAATDWATERIDIPKFDHDLWDKRLQVRVVDHVVPPDEDKKTTGGSATFVFSTLACQADKWRSGDGSTVQAIVLSVKDAPQFPEFMHQK